MFAETSTFIPTRCRISWLKQIRLVNMIPAILIILIVHIIIAIQWMLIKILSAVINHSKEFAFVAAGSLAALYHKRACFQYSVAQWWKSFQFCAII